MSLEVVGDDVRIVGSCDDWLMVVRPSGHAKENEETAGECFLVNAFFSWVVQGDLIYFLDEHTFNHVS
jgi:hypothetical protein